jgi:hypothetical protein
MRLVDDSAGSDAGPLAPTDGANGGADLWCQIPNPLAGLR